MLTLEPRNACFSEKDSGALAVLLVSLQMVDLGLSVFEGTCFGVVFKGNVKEHHHL